MPTFDSNYLNNPQMNQYSGQPMGYTDYSASGGPQGFSPDWANWYQQFTPTAGMSQSYGEIGGHFGQEAIYNPVTGTWSYKSSDVASGYYGDPQSIMSTDPETGKKYINMDLITGQIGAGAGAGYEGYEATGFGGGTVTPGEGYQGFDYSTIGSGIDPGAVIAAQEYKLQEGMEADMARAGARAGASGFAMSTPYMAELGGAARKASQDRNAITMQYQYDAAQSQAERDLAQQLQAGQLDFGGWQTGYQGDLQAQMANTQNAYNVWAMQNQIGLANNQGQNLYNQQQQQQQQNAMMQALSMIGGMGGGW